MIDRRIPVRSLAVDPPVGSLPHLHQVNSRIPGENQATRFPLSIDCVPFGSLFISLSLSLARVFDRKAWVLLGKSAAFGPSSGLLVPVFGDRNYCLSLLDEV